MRIRPTLQLVALLLAASMLLAACGSSSDEAAERTAEKIVEDAAGGDVDVDVDGENVTIDGKDGSFSTSDELPEGWPSEIEMPDGTTLAGSSAIEADGGRQFTTSGEVKGASIEDVVEHFEGEFDGWKLANDADIGEGDAAVSNRSWTRGDEQATLTVATNDGATTFVVGIGAAA